MTFTYTCMGCKEQLDPYDITEFGHVCDGWWDDHGVFDVLPEIAVSEATVPPEIAHHILQLEDRLSSADVEIRRQSNG